MNSVGFYNFYIDANDGLIEYNIIMPGASTAIHAHSCVIRNNILIGEGHGSGIFSFAPIYNNSLVGGFTTAQILIMELECMTLAI